VRSTAFSSIVCTISRGALPTASVVLEGVLVTRILPMNRVRLEVADCDLPGGALLTAVIAAPSSQPPQ
jgi:hypothetical protein